MKGKDDARVHGPAVSRSDGGEAARSWSCVFGLALLTVAGATVRPAPLEAAARSAGPPITAIRLAHPVRIDAVLDEPDWQGPSFPPLVQNEPDNGRTPRYATDWWIAYDEEALYLACRMHDTAPESIACGLGRRDTWPPSDWITLDLDTFNDDRTGYEFALTPAGSRVDAALYNDGTEDESWDGVWDSATQLDSLGWTVEMRIPFSQVKFRREEHQVWGVNLSRRVRRVQERDDLMHMPRGPSGFVSLFPDLVGISGVHPAHRPELLGYVVGRGEFRPLAGRNPFRSRSDLGGDAGGDIKWPLTSNMTLNATFNPDFGQVEVDPAVINLSDNETFYDEHRPFFVDDADRFRFGNAGTNSNWNFNWQDPLLFYSRRVGRPPQVPLDDNDFADRPGATTILGAAKLAGTTGRYSLGAVSAWTAREEARLESDGIRSTQVAEPLTNTSVVRILRSGRDGRHGIGIGATNTWRHLRDARSRAYLARDAAVVGLDGWTRLGPGGDWAVRGYLDASAITGEAAAIDRIQRAYPHYAARPGTGHLHYDASRTTMKGWAGRAMLNRQSGSIILNTSAGYVSPGFDANDAGFSTRSDYVNAHLAAGYRWLEPTRTFRSRDMTLAGYYSGDTGWNSDAYGSGLFWNATLANYWDVSGDLFYNPSHYSINATRGGPVMRVPNNREISLGVGSDDRKSISARFDGSASRQGDGSGSASGQVAWTLRPRSWLSVTCTPSYSWSRDHSGWVGMVTDSVMPATYGVRYLFATLNYREASLATRVDWTFTPRLTLQGYLQPLIGAGTYRGLKELAAPRTYAFNRFGTDRGSTITRAAADGRYEIDPDGPGPATPFSLANPDFNSKSFKLNLVLRWEYRPGSTFYFVWTQTRADQRDPGDFRLGRDVRSLLDTAGENTIQVKITKWWG